MGPAAHRLGRRRLLCAGSAAASGCSAWSSAHRFDAFARLQCAAPFPWARVPGQRAGLAAWPVFGEWGGMAELCTELLYVLPAQQCRVRSSCTCSWRSGAVYGAVVRPPGAAVPCMEQLYVLPVRQCHVWSSCTCSRRGGAVPSCLREVRGARGAVAASWLKAPESSQGERKGHWRAVTSGGLFRSHFF